MSVNYDVTSPRILRELFTQYGLKPRRSLGQNFLIDANIVRKIIAVAEIKEGDAVIEVGPGAGALTNALARAGANVLALEVDRGLVRLLDDLMRDYALVKILEQDALKISWKDLIGRYFKSGSAVKMISNLPYLISGPFIYALLRERFPFETVFLMLQKEVARRLVASPGDQDYSGLSVICQYYATGKVLFELSANVFWPRPKVDSAVVKLVPRRPELEVAEEELFWFLVQGVFRQRRKKIQTSLAALMPHWRHSLTTIFEQAQVDPGCRPEELSVGQFAKLTRIAYNYNN